jgi:hypothetical protein
VSFQLPILKILAGQPNGRASPAVLKRYLAVYYASGPDWAHRMKGLAVCKPGLDIFAETLIVREPGEWAITEKGRALIAALETPAGG